MIIKNYVTIAALVLGTAAMAKADVLSINGSDSYKSTTTNNVYGVPVATSATINFTSVGNVGGTSSGIFSAFADCTSCATMAPSLSFSNTGTLAAPNYVFTPTRVFSVTEGANTASVTLQSITQVANDVDLTGAALVLINGKSYNGTLELTTQGGGSGINNVTFSATTNATTSPVPEPTSLTLLGTGLLSVAGMARRKFFKA